MSMFRYKNKEAFDLMGWMADWAFDKHSLSWEQKCKVIWYVGRCQMKGLVTTADQCWACADRFMAGKRKITAPGTRHRKKIVKERRKLMASLPAELLAAIAKVVVTDAATQYRNGNEKALNALVGMVMKQHRADAAVIKDLLIQQLKGPA